MHEDTAAGLDASVVFAVAPVIGSRARVTVANPVSAAAERMWGAPGRGTKKAEEPEIVPKKISEGLKGGGTTPADHRSSGILASADPAVAAFAQAAAP
ncbi:hypothetical protein GCM10010151_21950 [Actinoallomurus spadix]|uniref:Uncharacterized protein n=1 Tax=Actinoallomurus spadix TaxID=79912 RepID=A0ABP3G0E3_9ACTN